MRHSKPVRLETAPTGLDWMRRSWKQRLPNTGAESVYLFLEFTIVGFEVIMQLRLMVLFEVRVQPLI